MLPEFETFPQTKDEKTESEGSKLRVSMETDCKHGARVALSQLMLMRQGRVLLMSQCL